METIQIVLEKELLHAADQAARRTKQNRSSLVRDALRAYLVRLELRTKEEQDRKGYTRKPLLAEDAWEEEAVWPEE